MDTELLFQPERLLRLAEKLNTFEVKPRVRVLEDRSELVVVDDEIVSQIPFFYGPVSKLPHIFRGEWEFNGDEYHWIHDPHQSTLISIQTFFGLSFAMMGHIFIPGAQCLNLYGGKILTSYALSRDIAFNIHHLILSQEISDELRTIINEYIVQNPN